MGKIAAPLGIGVDIEEIKRFRGKKLPRDERFLKTIFTPRELTYCFGKSDPGSHLAARFAAKEAAWKALTAAKKLNSHLAPFLRDVEILNETNGVPRMTFFSPKLRMRSASVSLAHSRTYAIAIVCVS
ncbi:MAG: 4'-phosphopantetheinyl transferase [Candidatus Kaiserbacteria bacterium GW2011_GWC2_52_8b]|uniref:Holo-[acyl-carrier-protein] synthase n=2 Tax=Candidatus Kaiseribacteriota TaxID=1752734 RepID=A0A0G1XKI8_9BACT|nr:MAG: 4'-phosphopantetheinyl transferase [Candidatus Kaiserbacteria bacterium GW2011_GWA2_52_12]KKW31441.1 MAG: 4'-phosphopantetheinyl transferase [Candidatus Kaiserbacteria bacterium GW2011_GWC2_52_8b]